MKKSVTQNDRRWGKPSGKTFGGKDSGNPDKKKMGHMPTSAKGKKK